ncbi:uncharacterized protein PV09_00620 [Verruconis gallopava]|uniref:Uncharacterized protein n=1 Tax=Verruconis gallopava TaxID=253628 RepID=A0A0D1Z6S6_9PEZI|nr:uncharacterized protein PV09_00620 [Verruconis gallopava]KIW08667.1 hypothetical protein PV09_00620 [Verruconis gallopava]
MQTFSSWRLGSTFPPYLRASPPTPLPSLTGSEQNFISSVHPISPRSIRKPLPSVICTSHPKKPHCKQLLIAHTFCTMSRNYSITEPHPSVASAHYASYGRGGAGNYVRINPKNITNGATAEGPASVTKLRTPPPDSYFAAGRGGAGNVHRESERAIFSFDEELERQQKMLDHQTPYYHIGRGGAGNLVEEQPKRRSSASSSESTHSVRHSMEAGLNKIRDSFSRR